MKTLRQIFGPVIAVLGLITALTPLYILPVCEFQGKSRMACTYTGKAEVFLGIILISLGIAVYFSKASIRWLMFPVLITGASVIVMPSIIGYCPNVQMPCHYGTVPLLRLLGGFTALAAIAGFIISKD